MSPATPGARAIELRVHDIGQLFHSLDPLPYRERDLDERVEEYVVGWAGEMPHGPSEIVIHLPAEQCAREEAAHVGDAIRNYFAYRAKVLGWELRELFRVGRSSLAVGIAVLVTSVVVARALGDLFGPGDLGRISEEGLIILGWVANWRPVQIFLYDWQPLVRKRRLYRRLATIGVKLAPAPPAIAPGATEHDPANEQRIRS
ncbi:hypothetical protein [Phenylobacterium sp.]|uniref:hypothetical protein n=1 Tax=Phenylobacterium sp. TaxID=1871053 RepID=UPI003BACDF1D